jgi:hypothetical protein
VLLDDPACCDWNHWLQIDVLETLPIMGDTRALIAGDDDANIVPARIVADIRGIPRRRAAPPPAARHELPRHPCRAVWNALV